MLVVPGEEQLPVAAARAGNPAAWDALFRRYQLPLYVYVMELLRNEQTALDVVQETFLVVTSKAASFQRGTNFRAWAWTIARYKVLQMLEKNAPTPERFAPEVLDALTNAISDAATASLVV